MPPQGFLRGRYTLRADSKFGPGRHFYYKYSGSGKMYLRTTAGNLNFFNCNDRDIYCLIGNG